ncbi:hypothetical protein AB9H28_24980, partial [Salmonella enterica subsp. enterica serovar Kentucky]|uniref:hypothetical protein n=1 Tax=Salmonella enterica TaxID=28901 RepID=UPI003F4B3C29
MNMTMTAVAASMPMAAMPTGRTFDDILTDVNVGDELRCVHSVTVFANGTTPFTAGKTYAVIEGEQLFTIGMKTIVDDLGCEVPMNTMGRLALNDLFEIVDYPPVAVAPEVLTTFGDMDLLDRQDLLVSWKEGKTIQYHSGLFGDWVTITGREPIFDTNVAYRVGESKEEKRIKELNLLLDELRETRDSMCDTISEGNTFFVGEAEMWDEMDSASKAAILLALHEGRPVQWEDEDEEHWYPHTGGASILEGNRY